ncbi:type II CRISPR-associated endonuclease Cas1, partial [Actinotignum urinale]|nr:type II CRISPR-associated endonuclease Cas1 [Actinotignum urinale]
GQANVLKSHGLVESVELFALARDVRSGDPGNIEARAARVSWKALWGHEDFRRLPGTGKDSYGMRNSHLDYAYTVLRGHGIRAVLGAGLSP